VQRPIPQLQSLRLDTQTISSREIRPGQELASGDALEIVATIRPADGDRCGIEVAVSGSQETLIGCDAGSAFVDRDRSGLPVTRGRFISPLSLRDGAFDVRIFVDRCSVEVFFNDGEIVFSALIHPSEPGRGVAWFSENGKSAVQEVRVHRLAGI
jgi:sucrose-6-phosphate hydrolase SacC (GH32 family)